MQGGRGERAREIIARLSNRKADEVEDADALGIDLGMDSLDAIDVALAIQEELCIDLRDEVDAITPAMTVAEVVAKVEGAGAA